MAVPVFIREGKLTDEGQQVCEYIEAQFAEADRTGDVDAINALPGHIKYYYLHVAKGAYTPEQFFEMFAHSHVRAAHRDMVYLQESDTGATDEGEEQLTEIAASLQAFRDEVKKEIANLKRRNTLLEKQVKGEVEAEADTDEVEPDDEPDDDLEDDEDDEDDTE